MVLRSRERLGDAALAAGVLCAELVTVGARTHPAVVLIAVAAAALLLLRRRHPVVVAVLIGVLYGVAYLPGLGDAPVSAMVVALYTVGRHTGTLVSAAVSAAGIAVTALLLGLPSGPDWWVRATVWSAPLLPVAAGHILRLRAELTARAVRQAADDAVRAERRRIARELHDVIAHHVSVVSLYMGVARRTIPIDTGRAQQSLLTGEQAARQAMTEMRNLLNLLRTDGEPVENQAGVGVARLPALVEESGNAELEVVGEAVELPSPVDHAIYRVVQEALTNTRKHAAGAHASVRLSYRPESVEVEVADDGDVRPGGDASGFGLRGMAERVSLCGGELRAGPAPAGGFVVRARVPLGEQA
ncbi:sensor histidine kinase [Nonomuraea typhae]|uniref:sensor histidine kinase n=1 Tax=Nonomuraea typhae TaxID=2603600 RepID=UPI0012F92FC1|nr:histidine kinase [Nonomuraea typhae]